MSICSPITLPGNIQWVERGKFLGNFESFAEKWHGLLFPLFIEEKFAQRVEGVVCIALPVGIGGVESSQASANFKGFGKGDASLIEHGVVAHSFQGIGQGSHLRAVRIALVSVTEENRGHGAARHSGSGTARASEIWMSGGGKRTGVQLRSCVGV